MGETNNFHFMVSSAQLKIINIKSKLRMIHIRLEGKFEMVSNNSVKSSFLFSKALKIYRTLTISIHILNAMLRYFDTFAERFIYLKITCGKNNFGHRSGNKHYGIQCNPYDKVEN